MTTPRPNSSNRKSTLCRSLMNTNGWPTIELKAAVSVGPTDAEGLVSFAEANSSSFVRGFVGYLRTTDIDLLPSHLPSRSILAVPLTRLLN
jgi:hypothetical protein